MRVFGIDPGSERTGYGCVETDGRRHVLVTCGAIAPPRPRVIPRAASRHPRRPGPAALARAGPTRRHREPLPRHNVRSALKLGHARGVAMLAAVEAGVPIVEYTPAEIKRAVVGYGRAEKPQVQQMMKLLLGLERVPAPHDAADALAVAICHVHCEAHVRATGARRQKLPRAGGRCGWRICRDEASAPGARLRARGWSGVEPAAPEPEPGAWSLP